MAGSMWEARVDGATRGPLTTEQLRALIASGEVDVWTPARAIGDFDWKTVGALDLAENITPSAAAFESVRRRAGWARALLAIYIVACVATLAVSVVTLEFFNRLERGIAGTSEEIETEANRIDAISGVVGIGYLIAFVAAGVAILTWVNRSARNARIVAPEHVAISPAWAVGWNFVPVASLWMPFRSMRQVWRASMAPENPEGAEVPGYVWIWWMCWVVSNLIANVTFRIYMRTEPTLDELRLAGALDTVGDALAIFGSLALWSMISRITSAQLGWSGAPAVRRGDA